MTDKIIYDYLIKLNQPIVKITAKYSTIRTNGENHCISECSYPNRIALCIGSVVMLLKNYMVELNLLNGSVGIVRKIVFSHKDGPKLHKNNLPSYVIVEFKNTTIPEHMKAFPEHPSNWVPIPLIEERCQKLCCTVKTIPLRICIALSIHKSQGMTIGPNQNFEKAIVYLPESRLNQRQTPGLVLVG